MDVLHPVNLTLGNYYCKSVLFAEPSYNEKELLTLIATGDEAAFTKLFNHYYNRVYTIAFKLSGSAFIAEEIVQDVLLKIWLRRGDLDHVRNFSAYLYTVIQNTGYKSLKRIARDHKDSLQACNEQSSFHIDPEVYLIDKEYHSVLQKGIEELPSQQKQVYKLIRERGLKRTEVADMLNLQPETVKFHLSKAVKNLWSFCQLHLHSFIGFTVTFFLGNLLATLKMAVTL